MGLDFETEWYLKMLLFFIFRQLRVEDEPFTPAATTTSKPTTSRGRTTSRGHYETEQEVPRVDRLTYDPDLLQAASMSGRYFENACQIYGYASSQGDSFDIPQQKIYDRRQLLLIPNV